MKDSETIPMSSALRWKGDAIRFLGAGVLNTALTLGIYQILLFFCSPTAAYALAWICGLLFVAIFYPRKVFGVAERSVFVSLVVVAIYVVGFFLGLSVVNVISYDFSAPRLGIFVSIACTTVFNFIVMRYVLARIKRKSNER
jgi:putative flippase GtrA